MLRLQSKHDLEGIFMCFIQPDVIMFHVGLQHHTLVDLIPPEGKDGDTVPQTSVDIYQIIRPKLLAGLLLLGCLG